MAAATRLFAQGGYDGTSLRAVARAAGVDPALVHHYFDGKAGLFAATMASPFAPEQVVDAVLAGGREGVAERLMTAFLGLWDSPAAAGRPRALLSALLSSDAGFAPLRGFLASEVFGRVTRGLDLDEPDRRAALVATQALGLIVARHVVELRAGHRGADAGWAGCPSR